MKIMIEVSGGNVNNIVATENVEIFLVDHDNLKVGEDSINSTTPDVICSDKDFHSKLEEIKELYVVEKKRFNVTIQRSEYKEHVFEVEATNRQEAYDAAREASNDYDFWNSPIKSADEVVVGIKAVSDN